MWTDDVGVVDAASTRTSPTTPGRSSWPTAIADGLQARTPATTHTASVRLGRAAQLAAASGNDATLQLLARVVAHRRRRAGASVRLREHVDAVDAMALDVRSTRTVRTPPA